MARSLAVQGIYHYKTNYATVSDIEAYLSQFENELYICADYELMHSLLESGTTKFDEMLDYYVPYLQRKTDEINLIEQAILVIAAVELIDNLSVPSPVIINEAIELAKLYGGSDSHKFINNLVDKLAKQLRPAEIEHSKKP